MVLDFNCKKNNNTTPAVSNEGTTGSNSVEVNNTSYYSSVSAFEVDPNTGMWTGKTEFFDPVEVQMVDEIRVYNNYGTLTTKAEKLLKHYNLKFDIKNYLPELTGKTQKELEKINKEEADKLYNLIKETIKAIIDNDGKRNLNTKKFEEKLTKYYNVLYSGATYTSVEEFRKYNEGDGLIDLAKKVIGGKNFSEGLFERLSRYTGTEIKDSTTCAKELEKYFNTYYTSKINEEGSNIKEVSQLLLNDIVKLAYNSTNEERAIIGEALKYLAVEHKIDLVKHHETIANFITDPELKQNYMDTYCKAEKIDNDIQTPGLDGKIPPQSAIDENRKRGAALVSGAAAQENKDYVGKRNNEFYTQENLAIIKKIEEKLATGIKYEDLELTEDEKKIWEQHLDIQGLNISVGAGTLKNTNIDDTTKAEVFEAISQIAKKTNENYEQDVVRELNLPQKEIEKIEALRNEIPDSNNTTSIGFAQKENVNNNTNTNVNNNNAEVAHTASVVDTPIAKESTNSSSTALGFTATAPKVDTTRLDSISQTITAQTTEAVRAENQGEEEIVVTKTTSFIKALQFGKEGVDKFFAENGTIKAVTEVFNNFSQISDKTIIAKALQLYQGLSSTEQADILVSAKNGALVELIKNSDNSALAQCQGETASNFWATKKINEAAEKALEKQA